MERPVRRFQKCMAKRLDEAALKATIDSINDDDAKAWLLNSGGEGGAFLLAWPSSGSSLSSAQFNVLLRARLGLPIVANLDAPTPCPRCGPHIRAGHTVPLLGPDGIHVLRCSEPGRGGQRGRLTRRHEHAKFCLSKALVEVADRALDPDPVRIEPHLKPIWQQQASYVEPANARNSVKDPRGDIAVTLDGHVVIADLVVTAPSVRSCPLASSVPDAAVNAAAKNKLDLYSKRFVFSAGHFVPLAVAAGGRFHSATRSFIKRFVTANLPTGTPPAFAEWSPATKSLYAARIRDVSNALSIAIARSVANALIDGESFLLPRPASLRQPPLTAVVGATADGDDDSDDLGWADVE